MAQLHGWFEDHRPTSGPRSSAGATSTARSRVLRAHPGRRRRGHHRRRHLTGLRAGGLRPRRRHGVEVRDPDRGSSPERLRPARAQHGEVAGHAERAAGVRADSADEHSARRAAAVRRGRRPGPRTAVHGRGVRPAHASGPADELRGEDWDRETPRYIEAASEEEMHELFRERRYTDFLPIILPTEERVERMLTGTSHARDEMVGKNARRSAWSSGTTTSRRSR